MRRQVGESRINLKESSTTRQIYKVLTGTKGTPGQSCRLQEFILSRNKTTGHWLEDQSQESNLAPRTKGLGQWELGLVMSALFKTEWQPIVWIKNPSYALACVCLNHLPYYWWRSDGLAALLFLSSKPHEYMKKSLCYVRSSQYLR